jgi:hypothetical protein
MEDDRDLSKKHVQMSMPTKSTVHAQPEKLNAGHPNLELYQST